MMVSIYNSMSDRRHEIAIMWALGARRSTVMAVILVESILLALGGGAAGYVLPGLPDPGVATRWGLPLAKLVLDGA